MRGVWLGLLQYLWIVQTPASPNEPLSFAKRPQPPRFSKKTKKTNTTSHHTKHPRNPNQAQKKVQKKAQMIFDFWWKKFFFVYLRDHLMSQNVKIYARIFQCWFENFDKSGFLENNNKIKIAWKFRILRKFPKNKEFFKNFQKIRMFLKISKKLGCFSKFPKMRIFFKNSKNEDAFQKLKKKDFFKN